MEEIRCCHPYGMGASKLQVRAVGGKFINVLGHGMEEGSDRLPGDLSTGGVCGVIVHSYWEESWEVEMMGSLGNTKHSPHRKKGGICSACPVRDGLEIIVVFLVTMENLAVANLIDG
jgi:hypothetical protein